MLDTILIRISSEPQTTQT